MKTYTVEIDDWGTKRWYFNGQLHREDGPAIEYADGEEKRWFINNQYHRKDGPAIEYGNGRKFWYFNGKLHREDGPAVEWADGSKNWYIDNVKLTEEEFNARTNKPTCAPSTNWEDVYRVQTARIEELERKNSALRAALQCADKALDDIDTAGDMFKPAIDGYFKYVAVKCQEGLAERRRLLAFAESSVCPNCQK